MSPLAPMVASPLVGGGGVGGKGISENKIAHGRNYFRQNQSYGLFYCSLL